MEIFKGLNLEKLNEIISKVSNVRVGLIGDICLDVYWMADMTKSELSRETPHFPLPVVSETMSLGAGGNAAANIAALKPLDIKVVSAIGEDWRGNELAKLLKNSGINTDGIVVSNKIVTNAYCKPIKKGISYVMYEDPRLDFNNYNKLPQDVEEELLAQLDNIINYVDVLCVSDQFIYGCITPRVREKIISFGLEGKKIVVDSRDRIGEYRGVLLKPNEVEGYRAAYDKSLPKDADFESYVNAARIISKKQQAKICMTLGPKGCIFTDGEKYVHIPAYKIEPPIDFCGAGDTFLSAFSCAIATGAKAWEAAAFANLAAEVTIKKIGTTGTASPEEIRIRQGEIEYE